MVETVALAVAAFGLESAARGIFGPRRKNDTPLIDEKPTSLASRGAYVPLLIGRRRLGVFFAWYGDRTVQLETQSAGGKGAAGSNVNQNTYFENGMQVICVGPAKKLWAVIQNGKKIWDAITAGYPDGLTQADAPSGSTFSTTDGENAQGDFEVWWGDPDDDADEFLGDPTRMGIASNWTFCFRIVWKSKRLGGFPVWQTLEYDVEVWPYNPAGGDRLTLSTGWFKNGLGLTGTARDVLEVLEGTPDPSIPFSPGFKIQGDHTGEYLAGDYLRASGFGQLVDGDHEIDSSSYSGSEQVWVPAVPQAFTGVGLPALGSWTKDAVITLSGSFTPPAGNGQTNQAVLGISRTGGSTDTFYSIRQTQGTYPGVAPRHTRFWFWIRAANPSANFVGAFDVVLDNGSGTQQHRQRYQVASNGVVTRDMTIGVWEPNGVDSTYLENWGNGWYRIGIQYPTGAGSDPSPVGGTRRFFMAIAWASGNSGVLYVMLGDAPGGDENGTNATGITTIYVTEAIGSGSGLQGGTVQPLAEGEGHDGANIAHMIDQLMFAQYPHGAGLDRSQFDVDPASDYSIEALGVALGDAGEGQRAHILIQNGEKLESALSDILIDTGLMIPWNPLRGLHEFRLIREPQDPIPEIPSVLLNVPPRRRQPHGLRIADRLRFVFANRDLEYRDDPVSFGDDGRANRGAVSENAKSIGLRTVTDWEMAVQVGARRQQEELARPTLTELQGRGDCRKLIPSRAVNIEDFEGVLRVMELTPEPLTGRVRIQTLIDSYSYAPPTQIAAVASAFGPPPPPDVPLDLAVRMFEMPAQASIGQMAVLAPRIRGAQSVRGATVYLSRDNVTYTPIGVGQARVSGGTLYHDIASTDPWHMEDNGPVIQALGSDILEIAQTLDETAWRSGTLWVLIDQELFFLRQVIPIGNGLYRLVGLLRGRFGTQRAAHTAGTTAYIFSPRSMLAYRDPLLAPDDTLYLKAQPETSYGRRSLAEVSAVSLALDGRAIKPLRVFNLRTSYASPSFVAGSDIIFRWSYMHANGARDRSGAGYQAAGEVVGRQAPLDGVFTVVIRDGTTASDPVVRETETVDPTYTYTASDRVSDLGSEGSFFIQAGIKLCGRFSAKTGLLVQLVK